MVNKHTGTDCPMAHALGLLGDRWTLILVREALDGTCRYEDFHTRLGISDHTLSRKLRYLVEADLFERTTDAKRPAYRLTPAGADLAAVLAVLGVWNQRWFAVPRPRKPPRAIALAAESLGLAIA